MNPPNSSRLAALMFATLADKAWRNSPRYEKYRQKDDPKIPFWFQPAKHSVGTMAFVPL